MQSVSIVYYSLRYYLKMWSIPIFYYQLTQESLSHWSVSIAYYYTSHQFSHCLRKGRDANLHLKRPHHQRNHTHHACILLQLAHATVVERPKTNNINKINCIRGSVESKDVTNVHLHQL